MALTKEAVKKAVDKKKEVTQALTADMKKSTGLYIADFSRVTVGVVTALRASLRLKGIKMKVAKNTLIRRSLADAGVKGLDSHLVGPTAVIMADDQDPMAPAKALVEFHKANEGMLPVKIVSIDGAQYPGDKIAALAKMPGKRELQASVVSLALGPGARLAGVLKGPGSRIAGAIKAHIEKLEGGAQ
jgi:large subunit ribosomal protein L10